MLKRVLVTIPVVLAAYALSSGWLVRPAAVLAQVENPTAAAQPQNQPSPCNTADMTKMHQQMMADMKTADAKLDQLAAQMNAATGEAKVAAMTGLLNELVVRQQSMRAQMGMMHDHMMACPGMMGGQGMMGGRGTMR